MRLNRDVSLTTALRYRGQGPMWSFVLHRVGGVSMAVFIAIHILASFIGGKTGGFLNAIYENWLFQIFIFFCVLFHAINGLRITIVDLFPKLLVYEREAIWVEMAVFLPLFAVAAFVIINTAGG